MLAAACGGGEELNYSCPAPDAGPPDPNGNSGAIVAPAENPYTPEKAILGKILFWDEQLSSDDTVACGTCHRPAAGGGDPRAITARHPGADGLLGTADDPHGSPGIARCRMTAGGDVERLSHPIFGLEPQVTPRKAPSYLDASLFTSVFWDGRTATQFVDPETGEVAIAMGGALESQSVNPPLGTAEMACEGRTWADIRAKLARVRPLAKASHLPGDVNRALCATPTYPELFTAAFGTPDITARRIAFALATHERTLVSDKTPWDISNGSVGLPTGGGLTEQQERGRVLYFGKALCARCHPAPRFANDQHVNLGFTDATFDTGRMQVTGLPEDLGKFQSATVRNTGLREAGGLLHDGAMGLDLLIDLYSSPPTGRPNVDPRMSVVLDLTEPEKADLIEFVRNGLTDPRVAGELPPFDRPTLASEEVP